MSDKSIVYECPECGSINTEEYCSECDYGGGMYLIDENTGLFPN